MRQVFIFIGFFICSSVLADHGGQGHSYNGRTFPCNSYEDSKRFAEKFGKGADYYNWALCQLHHGELDGITTLHKAADDMGDLHAAIVLAKYYISDNYKLSAGRTTGNKANLQEAIDYRKRALRNIRSQKNYPFDDLTGDNAMIERESHIYLNTAGGLTSAYVRQFGLRIMDHLNGITQIKNIRNATTIESLQNARDTADDCLAIPYKRDVWSKSVYNKSMDFCREKKRIAKALLPLEEERIEIASSQCQNIRLSECPAHVVKKDEMLELYLEHVQIARTQLAAL